MHEYIKQPLALVSYSASLQNIHEVQRRR